MDTLVNQDIFLEICKYISISDILHLRTTCKRLSALTYLTPLWHQIFRRHIIQQGFPLPAPWPYPGLSTFELNALETENIVRTTLRRHKNWSSPSPQVTSIFTLNPLQYTTLYDKEDFGSEFIDIKFIDPVPEEEKKQGMRWLVTVLCTENVMLPSMQWFQVRRLSAGRLVCLAARRVVGFTAWAVHESRGSSESILLVTHEDGTEAWALEFVNNAYEYDFVTTQNFPPMHVIHTFVDGWVCSQADQNDTAQIWTVMDPDDYAELHPGEPIISTILVPAVSHVTALIFRSRSIELFHIHIPLLTSDEPTILEPLDTFQWQYRIHAMTAEISPVPYRNSSTYRSINLLLRFGSEFPWPVNMLHRFSIHPNPDFPSQSVTSGPYELFPRLKQTQGSPVRLFADAPQTLGKYGTATWVDSHTEEYFNGDGRGQRLAGRVLLPLHTDLEDDHPGTALGENFTANVYRTREDGSWTKIAIDERMGVVALGCLDGRLDVMFIA